jgi:hypothetical protein
MYCFVFSSYNVHIVILSTFIHYNNLIIYWFEDTSSIYCHNKVQDRIRFSRISHPEASPLSHYKLYYLDNNTLLHKCHWSYMVYLQTLHRQDLQFCGCRYDQKDIWVFYKKALVLFFVFSIIIQLESVQLEKKLQYKSKIKVWSLIIKYIGWEKS